MHLTAEIKEFLEHAGKVLIFEDNEPKFVISAFKDYMNVLRGARQESMAIETAFITGQPENTSWADGVQREKIEEINREIEEIGKEDFFAPLAADRQDMRQKASEKQFYRELE